MGKREKPVRKGFKYKVNEKFFDQWTNQMAYILGFTYADGNIYKTSLAWDIQNKDIDLLTKFKKALDCTYPITKRTNSYRLRVSNPFLIKGATKRGLLPKKNIRNELPKMPEIYLRHFIRGFADGDGWVVVRKDRNEGNIGFVGCNKEFLEYLSLRINNRLSISGKVRKKVKTTPRGIISTTWHLEYFSSNAFKLAHWLYDDLKKDDLFLERKHDKYLEMKNLYDFLHSGPKKVRVVQKKFGRTVKELLNDLYIKQKLDGVKIAEILGVHSSSIYRWLAQTGIKYPEKRILNG